MLTAQELSQTSYFGVRINTTYNQMVNKLGKPFENDEDGQHFSWTFKNSLGEPCRVYDYHVRGHIDQTPDEYYFLNIGGKSAQSCLLSLNELKSK